MPVREPGKYTGPEADWPTYERRQVAEFLYKALAARGVPFYNETFTQYGSERAGYAETPSWCVAFYRIEVDNTYASRHLPWTTFWRLVKTREDFRRATVVVFDELSKSRSRGGVPERLRQWVRNARRLAQG